MIDRRSLLLAGSLPVAACAKAKEEPPNVYRMPSGSRFGMIGGEPGRLKPIVFRFLSAVENSLASWDQPHYGELLVKRGFVLASIDLPCHGEDQRKGELQGLSGWRGRADEGEPLMPPLVKRFKAALDYLIERKIADPARVAATGVSRGGYAALHLAAADPRVTTIAIMAPVVALSSIQEFAGYRGDPEPIELDRLVDRHTLIVAHDDDIRAGTEPTRSLVELLKRKNADIEFDVIAGKGHGIRDRDVAIADWVERKVGK